MLTSPSLLYGMILLVEFWLCIILALMGMAWWVMMSSSAPTARRALRPRRDIAKLMLRPGTCSMVRMSELRRQWKPVIFCIINIVYRFPTAVTSVKPLCHELLRKKTVSLVFWHKMIGFSKLVTCELTYHLCTRRGPLGSLAWPVNKLPKCPPV